MINRNLLSKIRQANGMTLLEVVISICIIGLIAGPFLSMFVFSSRHNQQSASVLEATFIAQGRMEKLQSMDYLSAIREGINQRTEHNGYYVSTKLTPYLPETTDVFHIILQGKDSRSGCEFYVVPPSGDDYIQITEVDSPINLNLEIVNHEYTFNMTASENYQLLTGLLSRQNSSVTVFINMTQYEKEYPVMFNTNFGGANMDVVVYDTFSNRDKLTITPINEKRYSDFFYRDHSMVSTKVEVYKAKDDIRPTAMLQSILELEN